MALPTGKDPTPDGAAIMSPFAHFMIGAVATTERSKRPLRRGDRAPWRPKRRFSPPTPPAPSPPTVLCALAAAGDEPKPSTLRMYAHLFAKDDGEAATAINAALAGIR